MNNYKLVKNTEWKEVEINGEMKEIPKDWEVEKINKFIVENNKSKVKAGDLKKLGLFPAFNCSKELTYFCNQYIVDNENLFLSTGGMAAIHYYNGKAAYSTDVYSITSNGKINNKFLFFMLKNGVNIINEMFYGAGLKHLNKKEFKNSDWFFPNNEEQSSIASILSSQESIIQDIESLISKYESRFQYLSDELLSGRLRVKEVDGEVVLYKNPEDNWKEVEINGEMKEFPKDWDVITLKDFGFVKTSSVDKKIKEGEQIVDLFNYMDVYRSVTKLVDKNIKFTKTSIKSHVLEENYIRKGDVFFTPSSETEDDIGYSATAIEDIPNAVYSYHLIRFRPNQYLLDEKFSGKIFNTKFCRDYFTEKCNGLTRMTLKKGDFEDLQICFPPNFKEQNEIYSIIQLQEELIEEQKTLLVKEKNKFDWLLDNLLSGKYLIKE